MEHFKDITDFLNYDPRFDIFIGDNFYDKDMPTGLKLHHLYDRVKDINLNSNIDEDIQSQFNIAKNLFVYSWYCYPFTNIAELKAISTLEYALKKKTNKKIKGLMKLLNHAINNNIIIDSELYKKEQEFQELYENLPIETPTIDFKEATKRTAQFIVNHRNDLAHGSTTLTTPNDEIFKITADFINQLYQ